MLPPATDGLPSLSESLSRLKRLVESNLRAWEEAKRGCKSWYGGIGILTFPSADSRDDEDAGGVTVTAVFPGYVAEAHGVLVGDTIASVRGSIRGAPGSRLDAVIRRRGRAPRRVSIIRERICVEEPEGDLPGAEPGHVIVPGYATPGGH